MKKYTEEEVGRYRDMSKEEFEALPLEEQQEVLSTINETMNEWIKLASLSMCNLIDGLPAPNGAISHVLGSAFGYALATVVKAAVVNPETEHSVACEIAQHIHNSVHEALKEASEDGAEEVFVDVDTGQECAVHHRAGNA